MCFFGGGGTDKAAEAARAAEVERQGRISQGQARINEILSGFNDNFYAGREKAYMDYATPQIEDQYTQARKNLMLALSRAGLSNSSAAVDRFGQLERQYGDARLQAADQAKSTAADARSKVESTRGNLYNQLYASADPAAAANAAQGQADVLAANPTFSPVAQLFQNVAAGIGAFKSGQDSSRLNALLNSVNPANAAAGSVRVVT